MAVASGASRPARCDLEARVEDARDAALDRLLGLRTSEGIWRQRFDLNAMSGSAYIVMLRTTGLIEQSRSRRDEALVARHIVHQANSDGGFSTFPGSPSSPSMTRLAATALRSVLGQIPSGLRPAVWYAPNPEVDATLARDITRTVDHAERFVSRSPPAGRWRREPEVAVPAALLGSALDPAAESPPPYPIGPRRLLVATEWRPLARLHNQASALLRQILPGLTILHHRARERARAARNPRRRSRRASSLQQLAESILARQNRSGDWFYCVPFTLTNMMALHEAGLPPSHPAMARAHRFVRGSLFDTPDGGLGVSVMNSDVWDTAVATASYLAAPDRTARDPCIRPAVDFLLHNQGPHGGYGWGAGAVHDSDCDSTAIVLRVLLTASRTAEPDLARRIHRAVRHGVRHITSYQNRQGSFGVWSQSLARGRPGAVGPWRGLLLDVPSADLAGRIVGSLGAAGLGLEHPVVRHAVEAMLQMQSPDGGCWCRWWAGYVSGTSFVLDGLGQVGLRYGGLPRTRDRHVRRATRAVERAVEFLLGHQNLDGGWGETIAADGDAALAGAGESRPLQTAAALLGLAAVEYPMSADACTRATAFLLRAQADLGLWEDDQATFTILPRRCYYRHPLYTASVIPLALSVFLDRPRG